METFIFYLNILINMQSLNVFFYKLFYHKNLIYIKNINQKLLFYFILTSFLKKILDEPTAY